MPAVVRAVRRTRFGFCRSPDNGERRFDRALFVSHLPTAIPALSGSQASPCPRQPWSAPLSKIDRAAARLQGAMALPRSPKCTGRGCELTAALTTAVLSRLRCLQRLETPTAFRGAEFPLPRFGRGKLRIGRAATVISADSTPRFAARTPRPAANGRAGQKTGRRGSPRVALPAAKPATL